MAFSKRFPKDIPTSVHPKWIEVALSTQEEEDVESSVRTLHAKQLARCIADAKQVARKSELHAEPAEITRLATALFDKQASHVVFYKEEKAKEKFEETYNQPD